MQGDFFNHGIGDLLISDEQKKINESMLKDAEMARKQNAALMQSYVRSKKVGASQTATTDKSKYLILGGVAILVVFAIIMTT